MRLKRAVSPTFPSFAPLGEQKLRSFSDSGEIHAITIRARKSDTDHHFNEPIVVGYVVGFGAVDPAIGIEPRHPVQGRHPQSPESAHGLVNVPPEFGGKAPHPGVVVGLLVEVHAHCYWPAFSRSSRT